MNETLPQTKDCPECQGDMFLQAQLYLDDDDDFASEVSVWFCPDCDYEEDAIFS